MLKFDSNIYETVIKVADARKTVFSIQQAALCFAVSGDFKKDLGANYPLLCDHLMNGSVNYVNLKLMKQRELGSYG